MALVLCVSSEWVEVFSSVEFSRIAEEDREAAAGDFLKHVADALVTAGYEVVLAAGDKARCHGWHGARVFATKVGPVGCYDGLSVDEVKLVHEVIDDAAETMVREWGVAVEFDDDEE